MQLNKLLFIPKKIIGGPQASSNATASTAGSDAAAIPTRSYVIYLDAAG